MIPFVLGGMISALLYWGAISLGLVSNFYILVSGTFPIFVQGFIQCLDPRIWVFTIVLIVVMAVVWYPFFKCTTTSSPHRSRRTPRQLLPRILSSMGYFDRTSAAGMPEGFCGAARSLPTAEGGAGTRAAAVCRTPT